MRRWKDVESAETDDRDRLDAPNNSVRRSIKPRSKRRQLTDGRAIDTTACYYGLETADLGGAG